MNKKILAILLVFAVVVTCFAACKRHNYKTTNVNGADLLLYTDKEGNTVINEHNQIIIVVTDEEGEIITHENGENQTYYYDIKGSYIGDGYIQDKNYKMNILEGWEGTTNNKVIKKNTDNKCYMTFVMKTQKEDINTFIENLDNDNQGLEAGFSSLGYTFTVEKKGATISKYTGYHYIYKMVDAEGKVIHYAENIIFDVAKTIYSVEYVCADGVGYDETFNFGAFVQENFKFNG